MKRILLIVIVALAFTLPAFAQKRSADRRDKAEQELRFQIYGNTAVVTGLDTVTGKNKGQPYKNRWLFMDVWFKKSGRWQCVKTYSTLAKN